MITDEEVQQLESQLMAMRERERALRAELETLQTNMRRQEGAIIYARGKLQQMTIATNGDQAGS